jgi:AraC family transcriptional regulator of adaptative response/methylated-DNA-[protein]-cysteine methyltransferase
MEWGTGASPFGVCSIGWNEIGICHLAFHDRERDVPKEIKSAWPQAVLVRQEKMAQKKIRKIFLPGNSEELAVFLVGTEFQLKVWLELLSIPDGELATYSGIAAAIGHPNSSRAVGTACGANPVAWLIPCHRVISWDGNLNGYRWGIDRKRDMLVAEGLAVGG